MKMRDFKFTGDVNALIMAMLNGAWFKLTDEHGRAVDVKATSAVTSMSHVGYRSMSAQVELLDLKIEATMSFFYRVEEKVVAPAVKAVEAIEGQPAVYGLPACGHIKCQEEERGVRFDKKHLNGNLLLAAMKHEGCDPRPAVPARAEVKVLQFCRCETDHQYLIIKFE